MRLKNEKNLKSERLNLRCTLSDYYDIKRKANIYADGCISEYITYAAKHYTPCKDDLIKSPLDLRGRRKPTSPIKRVRKTNK